MIEREIKWKMEERYCSDCKKEHLIIAEEPYYDKKTYTYQWNQK